ncbi:L-amino acid amidase [Gossypium arboreum]|uniref:L-amino acid amidase n=1 Tax=Gossypium arboreum TaxID=29729 RepID=A0A0B0N2V7_GOSAR|nr:L-amino acid amidase [Gossypium arboreum]
MYLYHSPHSHKFSRFDIYTINLPLNHLEYCRIFISPKHGIRCRCHVPDMVLHWLAHQSRCHFQDRTYTDFHISRPMPCPRQVLHWLSSIDVNPCPRQVLH